MKFAELNLAPELVRAVADLGYNEATPIQAMAIPEALTGKDVLGQAQTGTGKTAAFMLPVLQRLKGGEGLRALVLCPTRELAIQVGEAAEGFAKYSELFTGVIYGGTSVKADIRGLRAGYDVLVATPGRLIDHLERGNVDLSELETLVLDEADRMLDMGFRPQIDAILRHCPKKRQTLFFSATLPNSVKSLAYDILNNPVSVEAAPQAVTADGVEQSVYSVDAKKKTELLVKLLDRPGMDCVIVFTRTKFGADRVVAHLKRVGVNATVMHGDRAMKDRVKALDAFRDGNVRVLVATDVAQRGLDVEGISHVVNYDVPQDPDSYVHRVGRTARAGQKGEAITFMSPGEIGDLRAIERHLGRDLGRIDLEGFGFGEVEGETVAVREVKKAARSSRGRRMGSRAGAELTPEELEALLGVG
ncbi:MAG TPA: DEAD/DEAH box helicase [Longimicrobiaceae bacterium]|nr:DEAD/DEAH box helicase [Longimicrobiaceae bacterium]